MKHKSNQFPGFLRFFRYMDGGVGFVQPEEDFSRSPARNVPPPSLPLVVEFFLTVALCVSDDGEVVSADHSLQMLLPDEPRNQGGTHRHDSGSLL